MAAGTMRFLRFFLLFDMRNTPFKKGLPGYHWADRVFMTLIDFHFNESESVGEACDPPITKTGIPPFLVGY
jgi:hypothetical protein